MKSKHQRRFTRPTRKKQQPQQQQKQHGQENNRDDEGNCLCRRRLKIRK